MRSKDIRHVACGLYVFAITVSVAVVACIINILDFPYWMCK